MKKGAYLALILLGCSVIVGSAQSEDLKNSFRYVAFNDSMQLYWFSFMLDNPDHPKNIKVEGLLAYQYFLQLYEKNHFLKVIPQQEAKIPKIIHQIWMGNEIPQRLKAFQESWKKHHPDWEYKLWTQDDISALPLQNRDVIEAVRNSSQKGDLLVFEILYQYGGVYVAMDMECLQPLDELHHTYDFYAGLQPLDTDYVQLGCGIVGAIPKHPTFERCIQEVSERFQELVSIENSTDVAGPFLLTRAALITLGRSDETTDIVLPAHYFYPLDSKKYEVKKEEWKQQGSFTICHWDKQ